MSELDDKTIAEIVAGARMAKATTDTADQFVDEVFNVLGEGRPDISEIDIKPKNGDI